MGDVICEECYQKIKKYEITNQYTDTFFAYRYEGIVRDLIIKYKFDDKSYLYKLYAQCLIKNEKLCKFILRYDTIIPVPLHSKRKRVRGYNQAQLVAEEVIKRLNKEYYVNSNIVCENNVLIKTKNLQPQSKKGVDSRFNEIKDAFKVQNKEKIVNKKVLIFDDIYTTGSTANECKRVLANSGAKKVGILTIAKDYIE